jgi:hypothetical protein
MLLVASHPRRPYPRQLLTFDFISEPLQDVLRSLTAAVVPAHRGADEDVKVAVRRCVHRRQWSPTGA